jgi:antitoxin VapB
MACSLQKKAKTAKIFMHGRSQAVRLPKEFRLPGKEARVSKVGDKVILEPVDKPPFDVKVWRAKLDALGARDFLPDSLPEEPPIAPTAKFRLIDADDSAWTRTSSFSP